MEADTAARCAHHASRSGLRSRAFTIFHHISTRCKSSNPSKSRHNSSTHKIQQQQHNTTQHNTSHHQQPQQPHSHTSHHNRTPARTTTHQQQQQQQQQQNQHPQKSDLHKKVPSGTNFLDSLQVAGRASAQIPPSGFRRVCGGNECPAQIHLSLSRKASYGDSEPSEPSRPKTGKTHRGTRSLEATLRRREKAREARSKRRREFRALKTRWKGLPREDPGVGCCAGSACSGD